MQSNNRTVRGGITRYSNEYGISATSSDSRVLESSFSVIQQRVGVPNAPIINPLVWRKVKATYFSGSVVQTYPNGRVHSTTESTEIYGALAYLPDTVFSGDGTAGRQAYSKFLSKLRDSKADLSVDVAEGGSTYRMVTSAVDSIIDIARKARRHPTKAFADAWLQYQYGWKPLLSTIYEVANFSRTNLLRRSIKAGAHVNRKFDGSYMLSSLYNVKYDLDFSATIRYGCTMVVENSLVYDTHRLTSLNPLSIAWELVPYSFVVDWFYDIGGFLSDVETVCGGGFRCENLYRSSYTTWSSEQKLDSIVQGYLLNSGNTFGYETAKASGRYVATNYERIPLNSLPLPSAPRLEASLGGSRLLSGAALLRQLFR